VVGDLTFPFAYIIPVDSGLQRNPLEAYKFINHALWYGITVMRAKWAFVAGTTTYPAGTYVILMQQPLRGLANTMLWDGEDVKAKYGVSSMYDIAAWSLPYIWGFDRVRADGGFSAALAPVAEAAGRPIRHGRQLAADYVPRSVVRGGTVSGIGPIYWWAGDNAWAVNTANQMLNAHYKVGMVTRRIAPPFQDIPVGAFVVDTTGTSQAVGLIAQRARMWGLDFRSAPSLTMAQVSTLSVPRIQVADDESTVFVLRRQLNFASVTSWQPGSTSVPSSGSSASTAVVSSSPAGAAPTLSMVQAWLNGANGSTMHTYIGIEGGAGQAFAAGLLPGLTTSADPASDDNGVVAVDYAQNDVLTATYPVHGYAFAYPPYWFTTIPAGVTVDATYAQGVAGPFQQGFWNNRDQEAVGSAAMVSGSYGTGAEQGRVVFMGFHPTYRGMQDNTALLLARVIFLSAATEPTRP